MMMGGHKFAISPEEYVFAAIAIYLDILNLFLKILRLMAIAKRKWREYWLILKEQSWDMCQLSKVETKLKEIENDIWVEFRDCK